MLKRNQVMDSYFPEVRAWLIQIAAVMDRLDRSTPGSSGGGLSPDDPRLKQFQQSLDVLRNTRGKANRAEQIQMIFSDPID